MRVALTTIVLATACTASGPPPSTPQPVTVRSTPDSHETAETAQRTERQARFETFLDENAAAVGGGDAAVLERFVDPALGVFLITNPGAFIAVTHHPTLAALMKSSPAVELPERIALGCSAAPDYVRRDDRIPRFSCETETWDAAAGCTHGSLRSTELQRFAGYMLEYELIPPEPGAKFIARTKSVEPNVSHYVFSTAAQRGLFFGQVSGQWRLIYVRAIEECSA